jgi:hypothetical protein
MQNDTDDRPLPSPPLVLLAGWMLPGLGYVLIGHRARGIVVGATIILLYMSGLLIGGVRSIQVPGYGESGGRLYVTHPSETTSRIQEQLPDGPTLPSSAEPAITNFSALLGEIGNKPWSICQVMAGPIAIGSGAWSVWASRSPDGQVAAPGALSHSRVNEIAVLYTAVAGMLNLLSMIDAAGRADDALEASAGQRKGFFHAILRGARKVKGEAT